MTMMESELALWRDPEVAALAISTCPAWLWSADGSQILWANASGAKLLGGGNRGARPPNHLAAQIARIAANLSAGAAPRLARLRGIGPNLGTALTCACSRLVLAHGEAAVLVRTDPTAPALPLDERVRRLFADENQGIAIFTPDGALVHATTAARARLGEAPSLAALQVLPAAAQALEAGSASATIRSGNAEIPVLLQRLGDNSARVVALVLPPQSGSGDGDRSAAVAHGHVAGSPASRSAEIVTAARHAAVLTERRHPLRFVWQMDADGRFVIGSDEFIELVGPRTMAAFGRPWSEIADALKLDANNEFARAVATRDTWSGVVVSWPVDESEERLPVELSGLPVFDRDRTFRGYRGFGVCRDLARINQLARARRERPIGLMPAQQAPASREDVCVQPPPVSTPDEMAPPNEAASHPARPALTLATAAANVVPFRLSASQTEARSATLSAVERRAFRELAQELTARLRGWPDGTDGAHDGAADGNKPPEDQTSAPEPEAARRAATACNDGDTGQGQEETAAPLAPPVAQTIAAEPSLFDHLPVGVLIYRDSTLLHANKHILRAAGYDTLEAVAAAGGPAALFVEPGLAALAPGQPERSMVIRTRRGDRLSVQARLAAVAWEGKPAVAALLIEGVSVEQIRAGEAALAAAEAELRKTKREAQQSAIAKADFVAKISHEIRTPLNTITGFAEVIMSEHLGPIGNERYRDYLKDIQDAGVQLAALLNDLLDLSRIEAGQLDLSPANVSLNDLTQQCVGIMQPRANRSRIIIRTALTPGLHSVIADERTLRQIVLNLLANSIRFTGPGGQVIVSTAVSDSREVLLRVRDSGHGMSERDIELALEPFRQAATSGSWGSGGTGFALPLTKALAEANRAHFKVKSAPNAGTLVEIAFPPNRVAVN